MPRNLSSAYLRVAERALTAADTTAIPVAKKAGFLAYHSFECTGGAFCVAKGVKYPTSHAAKLRLFVSACKRERFALTAARLAIELVSLRNSLLYPSAQNGSITLPEDKITSSQVTRLIGRIRTLKRRVELEI